MPAVYKAPKMASLSHLILPLLAVAGMVLCTVRILEYINLLKLFIIAGLDHHPM